ncbi:MAG: hypothetical protein DIU67_002155 [Actinomycetes bacterium]|jgi:hypothetical protein
MLLDLEGWIVLAREAILRSEDLLCLVDDEAWQELFEDDDRDFPTRHDPSTFPLPR